MAETVTRHKPVVETLGTRRHRSPTARFASVVDRTTELSDEVLESIETGERAAIEAAGQFLITIEEALPQAVTGISDVAKMVTESGLKMADQLVHSEYDFLRNVVGGAAKSLSSRDGGHSTGAVA